MKHVLIALALALSACAQSPEPADVGVDGATACAARGGRIERVGRAQTEQCVITYADAGKPCTDGGECRAGRCLGAVDAAEHGGATSGQCQATNMQFGCYTAIVNGRPQAGICVD